MKQMSRRVRFALGLGVAAVVLVVAWSRLAYRDRTRAHNHEAGPESGATAVPVDDGHELSGVPRGAELLAKVRVRFGDGDPVEGAKVVIRRLQVPAAAPLEDATDQTGVATFTIPRSGAFRVSVSGPSAAHELAYATFPGLCDVSMERGSRIVLIPEAPEDAAWKDAVVWLQDRAGVQSFLRVTGDEVDAGAWKAGVVEAWLKGGPGVSNELLATIAVPDAGETRVPIRLPSSKVLRILVKVASDVVVPDWTARQTDWPPTSTASWRAVEREPTPDDFVYALHVRPGRTLLDIRTADHAAQYFLVPADLDETAVHVVRLEPGAKLEAASADGTKLDQVRVWFVRPEGSLADLPQPRRVVFYPAISVGGTGSHVLDVAVARTVLPAAALLASRDDQGVAVVSFVDMPPHTWVLVTGTSADGRHAAASLNLPGPGDTASVTLDWRADAELTVRVEDEAGTPLPGIHVAATELSGDATDSVGAAVTGEDGTILLKRLDPSKRYTLVLTDGVTTQHAEVPRDLVAAAPSTWTYRFVPGRLREVGARVVGPNAEPLAGALVSFGIVNGHTICVVADDHGAARALVPAQARVWANVQRPSDSGVVGAEIPLSGTVDLIMPPEKRGVVVQLELQRQPGVVRLEVRSGNRPVAMRSVFVDGRGSVPFPDVPPGEYDLRVTAGTFESLTRLKVDAGEQTCLNVRVGS